MTIKKLDDGQWLVDCRPEGRNGPRIRKKFRTKNEAMVYQNRIMGDGAKGEFEKRPKRDERRLTELVDLWYKSHGCSLKRGEGEQVVEARGDAVEVSLLRGSAWIDLVDDAITHPIGNRTLLGQSAGCCD